MSDVLKESVYGCNHGTNRTIVAKLAPYVDLLEAIETLCTMYNFKAAHITTCFGSLASVGYEVIAEDKTNPLGAVLGEPLHKDGPMSLLTAQGTVSCEEATGEVFAHVHAVFCDRWLQVHGGHLLRGQCPVLRTMEVVIQEITGIHVYREYNPRTDSVQLKIRQLEE